MMQTDTTEAFSCFIDMPSWAQAFTNAQYQQKNQPTTCSVTDHFNDELLTN